jgi:U3 small nucleolar RNA-associated protein 11
MSLKHVVHKRVHKERHQPAERQRLGYLEKHKDYLKRAKDFHKKEDAIKKLNRKAYFKNEDEFSFGMLSHKNVGNKTVKVKSHLSQDEIKLADSQDGRYIGMREQMDKKAIQKRAEQLHFLDAPSGPKRHTVFIDEDEDAPPSHASSSMATGSTEVRSRKRQTLADYDVAGYFDTHPALIGKRANRLRLSQLEKLKLPESSNTDSSAYKELFSRQERAKRLGHVREELELRQNLRTKGRRMKLKDGGKDNPAAYKWFPERKR